MNKGKIGKIFIIMLVAVGVFIALKIKFCDSPLFNYNLMDIITAVIVTVGIYILTEFNNDIRNKNQKIEEVVNLLKEKLYNVFDKPIDTKKQAEYLYSFKYIDNKIKVLEKLSKHLKCEDEIKEIKNLTEKLDEFISENLIHGNEYFIGETVKGKIPNILCNIETRLDNIVLKMYD